ncbi:MAG: PGF-CTERM-anchored ABC transporter substrate-binding protein [Salinirussus sp.]
MRRQHQTAVAVLAAVAIAAVAVGPVAADTVAGTDAGSGTTPVDCSFPVTLTDATGEQVTVGTEPETVVALAPSAAQTMWEIGAEEKVVGLPVNAYTAYLNGSTRRQDIVGADGEVVRERVLALEPDLVLAPNVIANDTVTQLRSAGLTVYRFRPAGSMADVYRKTELTGRLVGSFPAATRRSARMAATVEAITRAVEGTERPRVLYLFGPSGFTAGPETFIGELVARAGARNVARAANVSRYAAISPEVIAAADPEWIVVPRNRSLPDLAVLDDTTAIREGQVLRVNANYLNQPGPRNAIPLRRLAAAFHPEAMAAVDLDGIDVGPVTACAGAASTRTATTAPDGDVTTTARDRDVTTTGGSGPGFGVLAGAVALVTGGLYARRRRDRR